MHDLPHEHDHDARLPAEEEEHPLWKLDAITLTSVGIDIGTATSQIIFSRLVLRRLGRELSSRFVVSERKTLYLSPVHFTPYAPHRERIDDRALAQLVDRAYAEAGIDSHDVHTGAIILTGEAIRRDNARAIADLFAAQRGDFVCATAGHNFEAMLAAHGSGAVALSAQKAYRVLNIDIGGGTTKLAVCEQGKVLSTAAFHVGGRLIATDAAGAITVFEPGGEVLARNAGFAWNVGDRVSPQQLDSLADYMAGAVIALAQAEKPAPEFDRLWLTSPLSGARVYDAVVFSGGVGEYVYGKEARSFRDLGAPFGSALSRRLRAGALPWPVAPARECIRATVMGAAQHTVQVSGNTLYRSSDALLPRKNLQVLRPDIDLSLDVDANSIAHNIMSHFRAFDLIEGQAEVALVFRWSGDPSAVRLAAFCRGLMQGLAGTAQSGKPIYLVFDRDLAGLVGTVLKNDFELKNDILAIDGITLHDFEFIDLGKTLEPSGTVPVTIKSLVFQF
jgi:ethanolamine utilization protein EutA